MNTPSSVEYFDKQFQRQITEHDFALNPFESAALPYMRGNVLDFGCGLGNLAVHAARHGHEVLALDASPAAIHHLQSLAAKERLPIRAELADLRANRLQGSFETVVSIGLLMFFDCPTALRQFEHLKSLVAPGGVAVINVLVEGTTFMDMFSPEGHCLFAQHELTLAFTSWRILSNESSTFAAPNSTVKVFTTVIAEKLK